MNKFDELKFIYERTEKLSERRQITSQIYLTINTVIFGTLAFLIKDSGFHGWNLIWVSLPFFFVGLLACNIWYRIILHLESIIGWHYEQLRELEQSISESHMVFNKEYEQFFKTKGTKRFSFSNLEAQLPRLLIGLYIVYGICLVVAVSIALI